MNAFLSNLSLRPSCYACPVKSGKSGSDITLGDFWGIEKVLPEFDDNKGCSAVLVYTEKGERYIASLQIDTEKADYESMLVGNPNIEHSAFLPINRNFFFHEVRKCKTFSVAWNNTISNSLVKRIWRFIYRKFNR